MDVAFWFLSLLAVSCIREIRTEESCHYVESLGDMYCRDVNISVMRNGQFPLNVSKVIKLSVGNAKIKQIDHDTFDSTPELVYLDMGDNKISKLDYRIFSKTKNMQKLFLARNQVSHLDDRIFAKLRRLTHLDISGNPLSQLSIGLFSNQLNLLHLKANGIGLNSVPTEVFEQLTSLKSLEINDNSIKCRCFLKNVTRWAEEHCFGLSMNCIGRHNQRLPSVQSYRNSYCGKNRFTTRRPPSRYPSYPGGYGSWDDYRPSDYDRRRPYWARDEEDNYGYDYRPTRRRWDTRHFFHDLYPSVDPEDQVENETSIEINTFPVVCPQRHCRYLYDLNQMNCEGIPLKYFNPDDYPFKERDFTEFILDDNQLEKLEPHSFNALRKLVSLSLRKNSLQYIDERVFENLKDLEFLDVSENQLGDLWERKLFFSQKQLKILYLDHNNMNLFHKDLFKWTSSLSRLFILDNPLNCNCDLRPIFLKIAKTKMWTKATCGYPPLYKGEDWKILHGATYCRLAFNHINIPDQTSPTLLFFGLLFLLIAFVQYVYLIGGVIYNKVWGDEPIYVPDDFELIF